MRKKVGWIWIIGAIFLLIADFFTLGNQSFTTWAGASMLSSIIGFIICPLLILIGIGILILGDKK